MEFFATCPKGFERLLGEELAGVGLARVRPLTGVVTFEGGLADAYRACVWSRLASRIVVVLGRTDAQDADALYAGLRHIAWEEHLVPQATIAVDASGTNSKLTNTQFVALRAKDAIVDRLAQESGTRPDVDVRNPDARIVVRLSKSRATVGLDLAGTPLFQRGPAGGRRHAQGGLRADYAAALALLGIRAAGAAEVRSIVAIAEDPDALLVEAAQIACRRAPGLTRTSWGFRGWAAHGEAVWDEVVRAARAAQLPSRSPAGDDAAAGDAGGREAGPLRLLSAPWRRGTSRAKGALQTMGIEAEVRTIAPAAMPEGQADLLLCDASFPSAEEAPAQARLLGRLAAMAQALTPTAVCVAARDDLAKAYLRQEPTDGMESMLGREALLLRAFCPSPTAGAAEAGQPGADGQAVDGDKGAAGGNPAEAPVLELASGQRVPLLLEASAQFAARLRKNARLRAKWARREDVSCYRLYDSDLPDYAVSIDLFQGTDQQTGELDGRRWLQVYEYAAPRGVDPTLARARLMDALAIAPALLDVREGNTFLRVRRHDKGGSQYAAESVARGQRRNNEGGAGGPYSSRNGARDEGGKGRRRASDLPPGAHLIQEGGLTFEVNFSTRLDCGIFLDHRDTRAMLREMAKQTKGSKRFLNLFAYTGTATCYAADGGMKHTTTVDLSRPSLEWARRNMERNGFTGKEHEYLQEDVVRWVRDQRKTKNRWDLVFCDVPTFSNSNRMGKRSFDVQRDHVELLICVSRLLTREGTCVFSCNLRSFRPDSDALRAAGVIIEDITPRTIPEDFARNQRIHHAYLVRRG